MKPQYFKIVFIITSELKIILFSCWCRYQFRFNPFGTKNDIATDCYMIFGPGNYTASLLVRAEREGKVREEFSHINFQPYSQTLRNPIWNGYMISQLPVCHCWCLNHLYVQIMLWSLGLAKRKQCSSIYKINICGPVSSCLSDLKIFVFHKSYCKCNMTWLWHDYDMIILLIKF